MLIGCDKVYTCSLEGAWWGFLSNSAECQSEAWGNTFLLDTYAKFPDTREKGPLHNLPYLQAGCGSEDLTVPVDLESSGRVIG